MWYLSMCVCLYVCINAWCLHVNSCHFTQFLPGQMAGISWHPSIRAKTLYTRYKYTYTCPFKNTHRRTIKETHTHDTFLSSSLSTTKCMLHTHKYTYTHAFQIHMHTQAQSHRHTRMIPRGHQRRITYVANGRRFVFEGVNPTNVGKWRCVSCHENTRSSLVCMHVCMYACMYLIFSMLFALCAVSVRCDIWLKYVRADCGRFQWCVSLSLRWGACITWSFSFLGDQAWGCFFFEAICYCVWMCVCMYLYVRIFWGIKLAFLSVICLLYTLCIWKCLLYIHTYTCMHTCSRSSACDQS
jgi:hypothetical protein